MLRTLLAHGVRPDFVVGSSVGAINASYFAAAPDAEGVARAWAAKNGGVPINHMVVVRDTIVKSRPDVVKELYRLLLESKRAAKLPTDGTPEDPLRFGIEPNRKALETIIGICAEQRLIARRFTVDELFEDTKQILGL